MALILDGKHAAQAWMHAIREQLDTKGQRPPGLAAILVGHHPASEAYVKQKQLMAQKLGIVMQLIRLADSCSQRELLAAVQACNSAADIDGVIVQMPLPKHINAEEVLTAIDPAKDIDGFHPNNLGCLISEQPTFVACTPYGIDRLLQHYNISLLNKEVAIVGRSRIVGRPLALLWLQKRASGSPTVTIAHSQTKDLCAVCRRADILVVAAGVPGIVGAEHVKPGAVVIDVGIHRVFDMADNTGRLIGDVRREEVEALASALSPVPGGVGPMTVMALMANTIKAYLKNAAETHNNDLMRGSVS